MIFRETSLSGAWSIRAEPICDARGAFARLFDRAEFAKHELVTSFEQASLSSNTDRLTLRGMHYQGAPHGEVKLIRCTRGRLFDVIIDLRDGSPTWGRHHAQILDSEKVESLYVPEGFAHGFLTLAPNTEIYYQMSTGYVPGAGRGVRWNDPVWGIEWPEGPAVISERDAAYPDSGGNLEGHSA